MSVRKSADTTRFYVSVANAVQGVLQLRTYTNTDRCDGWNHISELRFNGRVVPFEVMKPGYTLTVP